MCFFVVVLQIDGTLEEPGPNGPYLSRASKPTGNQLFIKFGRFIPWDEGAPVLNRIYYSSGNNLTINAVFDYRDSIMCNWKTIPKEITTNNKRESTNQIL
jgi:hypothetical protein